MKKRLQKMMKNEKGLTLVELLAVIVILGIIAAIAVPSIGKIIENTKYNAVKADAINALNAGSLYFADDSQATTASKITIKNLTDAGYLETAGKLAPDMEIINSTTKKITGVSSEYTAGKTVEFDATLEQINKDNQKGSTEGAVKKIPVAAATS